MRKILLSLTAVLLSLTASAQWTDSYEQAVRALGPGNADSFYENLTFTTSKGDTYVLTVRPNGLDDYGRTRLDYRMQILDANGHLVLPEGGQSVCNYANRSYLVVNTTGYVDNDNNFLVIAHDARNAAPESDNLSYTVYKFNAKGESLWEPVMLWDGETFEGSAGINVTQTTDGGYVFTWLSFSMTEENAPQKVHIEKVSKEGKSVWKRTLSDTKKSYGYPYVQECGDNEVMLVYLYGSNQTVYAQKLTADGQDSWETPVKVYQGGFDQIPVWTHLQVEKAPDGVFISWRDDRNYEDVFSGYISYIKKDGTYGFPNTYNALKVSYASEYSRMEPHIVVDEAHQCLYAIYRQYSQAYQSYKGIFMQKIGFDGDLKWGPEGVAVVPIQNSVDLGYFSIQMAGDNEVAAFWQQNVNNVTTSYYQKFTAEGEPVFEENLCFNPTASTKLDLCSSRLLEGKYWVMSWLDYCDTQETDAKKQAAVYLNRLNVDGTMGGLSEGIRQLPATTETDAPTEIYDTHGRRVPALGSKGVYLVKRGQHVQKVIR